ncbi:helix-turn-helix domain-containing protein [Umezawaea endophytica]|uniref:HTH-type transcriptional regulator RipA n=1 Tax=Umezawaea endophytica TaxID=1654476 RepID=A0A9X2VUD6_9PSEU|nr:AraC family transcriptional regulator [Umezawaea endophytica]MCS7483156.1 AraC family transcriptional regulator [Umezawaea endophytica]
MPKTRQPALPLGGLEVITLRRGAWLPDGYHLTPHRHTHGQLVYAAAGALATTTERGTWIAPANRVTWTPPGFDHSHRFYGRADVRVVAVPVRMCGELWGHPGVFAVSHLLREAILTLTGKPETRSGAHERLLSVMIDELTETVEQPLHLPEPHDDRLRAVTDLLHADPGRTATLAELGRAVGASERTLSRLFHTELGMSFHRWRTILRIHHALQHLTNGVSVTATAIACGWSNSSSLIEAFTDVIGQTPGRYQADHRKPCPSCHRARPEGCFNSPGDRRFPSASPAARA